MQTITVEEIDNKLKTLSEEKLTAVYYFVSYLSENNFDLSDISARDLFLSSESLIAKDWNTEEEDKTWASL
ncbi:MAG: hypothetical protein MUC29_10330 [Pyrinomonadaceae bacterium]|jgi:hypothetical protein|nr:hypothetical protein [Pyrinomonadaceae bacterium]